MTQNSLMAIVSMAVSTAEVAFEMFSGAEVSSVCALRSCRMVSNRLLPMETYFTLLLLHLLCPDEALGSDRPQNSGFSVEKCIESVG